MIDQPETQAQEPQPQQEPLVLPAYSSGAPQIPGGTLPRITVPIRPEQLIRHTSAPPPKKPLARLRYFWQKDPAYKVLMIAVAFVLLVGLVCVSLVSLAMLRNPKQWTLSSAFTQDAPVAVGPTEIVDLRPTFAPPSGGQGSGTSSLPPAHGTPIVVQPTLGITPTDQPNPSPTPAGVLTVQITDIPARVMNNSLVSVGVNTSEANVTVTLVILYNGEPFRSDAGPGVTDDGGNANIDWMVLVHKADGVRAVVFAIAKNQSGQRAQSQPVSVQIIGFGG